MRKMKKLIAGLLVAIMVTASVSIIMPEVKAEETGSAVEVKETIEYVNIYINGL